jgi:inorganic pyrophosphatase
MSSASPTDNDLYALDPFDGESGTLNVIIETPRGHHNKFSYDHRLGIFRLGGVLPAGAVFPFDFGFLPSTLAEDGDPIDVLVLMDEPAFPGCLIPSRLIGVIQAEQTERNGETMRNDRLIAVAERCPMYGEAQSLEDVGKTLVNQIEHFFVSYNSMFGKQFRPCGRAGHDHAQELIRDAQRRYTLQ